MIITCPSCQTRFRLDPDRIGPSGARIRCSACKAVFRLAASGEVSPDVIAEALPSPSGPGRANLVARPATPGTAASPKDPFAPAAPTAPPRDDPFAHSGSDPFVDDPFAARLGPDPFSLDSSAAAQPTLRTGPAASHAPALRRAADALELAPASPAASAAAPAPAVEPDALSLEDSSPPAPRSLKPPPLPAKARVPEPLSSGVEATKLVEAPPEEPEFTFSALSDVAPDPGLGAPAIAPSAQAVAVAATPEPVDGGAGAAGHTATSALPRLRRRTGIGALAANSLSLVLLLALTAGLLAWRGDLGRGLRDVLGANGGRLEPVGVRAGLYDTAAGPAVLVVRGEVRAQADAPGPVRVRVALLEGSRTIATAEALAGASASPEQVFAVSNAADVAALRRSLDGRAAAALPAGAAAPFLVLFPAPLPDLAGLQVRTVVEAAPGR